MYLTPKSDKPTIVSEPRFDLPHLLRIARRRQRLMAVVFLLIVAATAAITLRMRPVYTATAHLMIDRPGEELLRRDDDTATRQSGLDSSLVETEVQVLRSPSLSEAVVRDLRLYRDPEFNPALSPPGPMARIRSALPQVGAKPPPIRPGQPRPSPVADALMSHLKVSRIGASYMVDLAFSSRDPEKAARIANTFANDYLKMQLEAKFDASHDANVWLDTHIGELRQRVVDADTALQNYKIQHNLLSAQGATLTEQEISNLDQQAALTRAQQAEAKARLDTAMHQLANGSTGDDVGEAMNSPVIQQLRAQRATISAKIGNMEMHYGPRYPDLVKAKGELADVDTQIQVEIKRIISNLQAQTNVARERTSSMQESVAQSRANLAQSNRSMVRLAELQRDADAERGLYENFLNKFKEMGASAGLARTDAHIVSIARVPLAPSAPRKALNLAFGAALGLAAAIGAALVAEMFEGGLTDGEVVERELGVPYLGSVPSLSSVAPKDDPLRTRPIDHLVAKPMSSFAESVRSLKAAVEIARPGSKVKVLAVTSSLSGEGKTTTSVGLARSAAIAGLRTVVVDCDLRQRAVNRLLGVSPTAGLIEVLNGAATLDQALIRDEPSGAMVLPLVEALYTPRDVFGSDMMAALIVELKRRFDLVVLDTAPVVLVTEARTVARHADAAVLLVHWRKTPHVLVQSALRLLATAGVTTGGVALTRVNLRHAASVDPGDPTAYYLKHRKYYAA